MKSFLGTVLSRVSLIQRCSGKSYLSKEVCFHEKKKMEKLTWLRKILSFGTSLVAQCLRLGVSITGVICSIPGQGPEISHTPWHFKKKKKKTEKRLVHGLSWHYFYILFITFNLRKYWSIVDLQCVSFRCTVEWFSYTHIYPHLSGNLMLIGYWRILSRCPAAAEGGPWWLSSPYWLVRGSWSQALNLSPHPAAPCLQNHFPFGTRSLFSICVNPSVLYTSSFVSFFF